VSPDAALGVVLSVFFGFGLVLLTYIQRNIPDASQAGLDHFLRPGRHDALRDLTTMVVLGAVAVVALLLLWKEFKLLTFDPDFAATVGLPVRRLDVLLTTLLVVAIVIGLQTVGVVLMSAMIVAPAAAARQWTDRLGVMVGFAALFGAAAGVSGAVISGRAERLPTGPTVFQCRALVVLSLFVAPAAAWSGGRSGNGATAASCTRRRARRPARAGPAAPRRRARPPDGRAAPRATGRGAVPGVARRTRMAAAIGPDGGV
jgi:manganese/zinc/iron transport system permease protein